MLPIHHSQHPGLGNNFHLGPQQRRPSIQQLPSPGGLGGMGGPGLGLAGRAGKSGLSFDHILNRLQSELQKSREAGSDLSGLTGTMNEINESFQGGSHPPTNLHQSIPPVRPPPTESQPPPVDSNVSLSSLHTQLAQTQSNLASHVEKLHSLESVIADHQQMKLEVQHMRELMEQRQRDMESLVPSFHSSKVNHHVHVDDDDDRRSILTLVPESSGSGALVSSTADRDHDDDERGRSEAIRPRTPEPHGLDEDEDDAHDGLHRFDNPVTRHSPTPNFNAGYPGQAPHTPDDLRSQNAQLASRLEALTSQLDTALSLSQSLQQQAEAAQFNLERLQARVESLEAVIEAKNEQERQQQPPQPEPEPPCVPVEETKEETPAVGLDVWEAWTQRVEGQWKVEREEWDNERLRLKEAAREWEARMCAMESREEERVKEGKSILDAIKLEREAELKAWSSSGSDIAVVDQPNYQKRPLVNGMLKHLTKKRSGSSSSSSSKVRKRKVKRPIPVATPPRSPDLNGEIHSVEHSSEEGSGSRSNSPAPPGNLKPFPSEVRMNGHAKFGSFPISPAPSVRNTGPRSASAGSEIDTGEEGHRQRDITPGSGPPPTIVKVNSTSSKQLGNNPLPLVSAAGVVFIGVAAWVVANRMKD
ncbi:uncharacterized protein EI90DRAFT_3056901 [Cantharellus anzutake]|uniref:uncharacterized protein n=1 Tax=Cantharellus anzutake TaxID=1750568 RepID=UPI001904E64E|nr:uncharacterized protein EI90DRAFT_3056901 [Cantharellus anzutake]KAF8331670.1 hypothetical protein EI90DRAFT_3056901 [Cantharellus anzutake]